ncbi:MAG: hypothetical protein ABSG68_03970 [Thermoguttaceae bacterium]
MTIGGAKYERLAKRHVIFQVVRYRCDHGVTPDQIIAAVPSQSGRMFRWVEGEVDSQQFVQLLTARAEQEGKRFDDFRFFCKDTELIRSGDKTYAFTNQWGGGTYEVITYILQAFPDRGIACSPSA